jgi:hypothetical protein
VTLGSTTTITMTGRLDGVRTRRRIFYLELESGAEVYGAVDLELLEDIRVNLNQKVIATLEEQRITPLTGKRSRPYYRMVRIDSPRTIF